MRIAVFGSKGRPTAPGSGGVERGVEELVSRLVAKHHHVTLYERGAASETIRRGHLTVRIVPHCRSRVLSGWSHVAVSIIDWIRRGRVERLTHLHCAQHGAFAVALRLLGAKIVFHLHGAEWRATKWSPFVRVAFFLSCLVGVACAHQSITVCADTRSVLERWLPWRRRRLHLVPNGCPGLDDCGVKHRSEFDYPFLLFAGRLVPHKRLDLLLDAYDQCECTEHLVIAGSSSYTNNYVSTLKSSVGMNQKVHWVGQLDRSTLIAAYRHCTAIVVPSDMEGCSNVLLEALVSGCCIVASDIPQNVQVVRDAARTFSHGDSSDLAETLRHITSTPPEVARLRRAARERAADLPGWDDVTWRVLEIYARVLNDSSRSAGDVRCRNARLASTDDCDGSY